MKRHYASIVAEAEARLPTLLMDQYLDSASPDYGGRRPLERGYAEPGHSAGAIDSLISVYLCADAGRYGEAALLHSAELYADHLLRSQHDDGTMDLKETNFHDATMIGFCTQTLAYTCRLLAASAGQHPEVGGVAKKIETFLRHGGEGMLTGGFHTPNHRWVLASALALLCREFDDDRFFREAELYLGEGIDCSELGEYTERSVGIYNVVNNRSLLIIAEELNRPELRNHVRRNLDMVLNYLDADGSLFTAGSRRQDRGKAASPISYYENYLLMAHLTGEAVYAGVADQIVEQVMARRYSGDGLGAALTRYMLSPTLRDEDVEAAPAPSRYQFHNPDSGIARMRHEKLSVTLLAHHTRFLHLLYGEVELTARIATTFYGDRGRFGADGLVNDGDDWVLTQHKCWGFKRPFTEPPTSSDWAQMPHDQRQEVQMRDLDFTVRVCWLPQEGVVEIHQQTSGLEGVLYKLELILGAGGQLQTESLRWPAAAGQWLVLGDGGGLQYRRGRDTLHIEGGSDVHNATMAMRGSEAQEMQAFTVYSTHITPVDSVLRLRFGTMENA